MEQPFAVGCVIMASGRSTRFGSNKLLAPFGGQPLLCRAFAATHTPLVAERVVVTRHAQVQELCNQEFTAGSRIRLMPDIHGGDHPGLGRHRGLPHRRRLWAGGQAGPPGHPGAHRIRYPFPGQVCLFPVLAGPELCRGTKGAHPAGLLSRPFQAK